MLDLTRHPRLVKLLSWQDRILGFVKKRFAKERVAETNLSAFYARVWREAAAQLDAQIEDLGHDVFDIRLGDAHTRVLRNFTAMDDLATYCVARAKSVIYRLLNREGIPTPRYLDFETSDLQPAAVFMEERKTDCVVKPASGTGGGLGVTTGVHSRWQLARAASDASRFASDLLIEEQIEGDNYRLLYLDGKLIDAVVRRAPSVVGDGTSRISQLVDAANQRRLDREQSMSHDLLSVDLDMRRTLEKQGLSLGSIPEKGRKVVLKTVINQNSRDDNETVTGELCEALIAAGSRAAAVAGVRLAGVDVITADPAVPLQESGGVILEVNSPPGYFWHYHKRGPAFPLAVHVLECLLASSVNSNVCVG